jgi:hypothetical protein
MAETKKNQASRIKQRHISSQRLDLRIFSLRSAPGCAFHLSSEAVDKYTFFSAIDCTGFELGGGRSGGRSGDQITLSIVIRYCVSRK